MMKEIKTPDVCINELREKIPKQEKAAFWGAIIVGLLAHIYTFVNKLYNYDELPNTPGGFIGAGNNRWFLELTGKAASHFLGGSYSLPFFSGIITLVLLALSAWLVVRMFEVKSNILSFCVGGFMSAFPAVVSLYCFMFLAPNYAVGIFLSVLAAYFLIKHPKSILYNIAALIVLSCAIGTYQAYFADTACLLVMSIILLCAFGKEEQSWKEIVFVAVRYVLVLAAGMVLYFVLNKVLLRVWGSNSALGGYQGLDTMGQVSVDEVIDAIGRCYQSFVQLFYENVICLNNNGLLMRGFRIAFLLLVIGGVAVLYLKKGEWLKKIIMLAGFLVFPVAMFVTYIMAPQAAFYALMAYAVVFLLVFALIWVDYFYANIEKGKVLAVLMQWVADGMAVVMLFVYIWYANGCYMSMEYTKMHDLAYFETLVTQIKSMDGYDDEMKVAFIGTEIADATNSAGSLLDDVFKIGGKAESNVNGTSAVYLVGKYLGFMPQYCTYEETRELMELEEVKEMNTYPEAGSIQVINDTIIVKFSNYEE